MRQNLDIFELHVELSFSLFDSFFFVFQENPSVVLERDFSGLVDVGIEHFRNLVRSRQLLGVDHVGVASPEAMLLGGDAVVEEFG